MEKKEYDVRLERIEREYVLAKNKLYSEYGKSQAIYKIGDIIKDSRWAILIDNIDAYKYYGDPQPVYSGPELKKDLKPKLNGARQSIHGNDGITLVKKAEELK